MENTAQIDEETLDLQTPAYNSNAEPATQLEFKLRLKRRILEDDEYYLSTRTYNVCKNNGLLNVEKLMEYYQLHKGFRNLKNIGLMSNEELIGICKRHLNAPKTTKKEPANLPPVAPKLELTAFQEKYMDGLVQQRIGKLSVRSRNYLNNLFQGQISFKKIFDTFLGNDQGEAPYVRNAGVRSKSEVLLFAKGLHVDFEQIKELDELSLKEHQFRQFLKRQLGTGPMDLELLVQSYLDGNFRFFQFLDLLFRDGQLIDQKNATIILRFFTHPANNEKHNQFTVGNELGLSRERVRQLYAQLPETMAKLLQQLAHGEGLLDQFSHYGWHLADDLILVTDDTVQAINQTENVKFSQRFYTLVLWVLHGKEHKLLKGRSLSCEYDYLIKNDLYDSLNLRALFNNMRELLHEKPQSPNGPPFSQFVQQAMHNTRKAPSKRLLAVCKQLLQNTFAESIQIQNDGQIIFRNFKPVQKIELLIAEILQQANRPLKLEEIHDLVNQQLEEPKAIGSIHSYLLRFKYLFIYFGRTFTFGLRQWETQLQGIKGGFIRQMVHDFLEQQDKPTHINHIVSHVLQYRPNTNKHSIVSNLSLSHSPAFQYFKNSYYSLISKKHAPLPVPPTFTQSRELHDRIHRQVWEAGILHVTDLLDQLSEKFQIPEEQLDQALEALLQEGKLQISADGMLTPGYGNQKTNHRPKA